jgi:23S rRNA pseudouridine2605 synthase
MPRANKEGGRSTGRRGNSRTGSSKSFSGAGRSSGKPFKKSTRSSDRDGSREERPGKFAKRPTSRRSEGSFGEKRERTGGSKPFKRSSTRSEGEGSRGGEKPFKKFDRKSGSSRGDSSYGEKSERRNTRGSSSERRSSSSFGEKRERRDSRGSGDRRGGSSSFGEKRERRDSRSSSGSRSYGSKSGSSRGESSYGDKRERRDTRGSSSERSYGDKSENRSNEGRFKKFNSNDGGSFSERRSAGKSFGKSGGGSDNKGEKSFDKRSPRPRKSFDKSERSGSRDSRGENSKEERGGFFSKQKRDEKYRGSRSERTDEAAPVQTEKIRLNRFIANSGVCSRREADELITMGLISVNGKTISELGYKVNPGDEVRYENKILRAEKPVYILLNKPKGYLTTTEDPQERNTVMQLVGGAVKERIYPVGRLDRNTTGLLLLTNDGDLADKLMHPSYGVKKIYKVELDRPLSRQDFETILSGVQLEEGRAGVDDLAIVSDDGKTVGIELHIGWNRVVRRIFESLNYEVIKLDRSVYAGLDKKDLSRGHWRYLTREEIVRLKHYK